MAFDFRDKKKINLDYFNVIVEALIYFYDNYWLAHRKYYAWFSYLVVVKIYGYMASLFVKIYDGCPQVLTQLVKMSKLLGWMPWLGFESQILQLYVSFQWR